jgi:hypothetical protein
MEIANDFCRRRTLFPTNIAVIPDLIRDPGFLLFSGPRIKSGVTIFEGGKD